MSKSLKTKVSVLVALGILSVPTLVSANEFQSENLTQSAPISQENQIDFQSEIDQLLEGIDVNSLSAEEYSNLVKTKLEEQGFTVQDITVTSNAYARSARKSCPGKYKCDGKCLGRKCGIYKVQKISVYYSLADCRKIANQAHNFSSATNVLKFLSAVGKKPVPGFFLSQYGSHLSSFKNFWEGAASRGKGVSFEYEYCIHVTQSSSFARNSRVIYK
ncbi:hypothetical protein B2H97_16075 [Paraclostridium bifermentans]|uniref:hypothetical protein n=1 Tax=Paraclostridium bifermentans TaxID=1490 RepID=UPI000A1776EA|nr:hypothetical protein [Paraclostridium bifermentans]OSB07985.1 hypothetical protein B2H97_16075 [Paraclostridium bifermentans]